VGRESNLELVEGASYQTGFSGQIQSVVLDIP
jgi:hypothetical protein